MWYKLLLLTVHVLHWFNPLVWLLRREAEEDLELVCDRETTRGQSFAEKQEYGGVILKTASEEDIVKETARRDIEAFFDTDLEGIPVSIHDLDEFVSEGVPKRMVSFFEERVVRNDGSIEVGTVLYHAVIEIETQTITELSSLVGWAKTTADAARSGDYIAAAAAIARDKLSLSPDSTKAVCYLLKGGGEILDNFVVGVAFPDELLCVDVSVTDLSPGGFRFFSDAGRMEQYLTKYTAAL
jgi:hypothetical protein